uniref:NADH-ubiquinone oxidoreductase chain 4 n=2 Tax=Ascaridia galli TaxID=46685 RepID=S4UCE9_9BILA|nr:NADH dehydrogenase subunit 4 [Ascaridia galli]AGI96013.1 NADH dehydrogenase subunit 4 [Ascaridia galli]ANE06330.1 NADH dehydrogenase subunit 4 [Ascaridia galli]ANE06333.1 NADH dehydrogenase subunit 4 [Ascaridia galli]ANE06334.1 NADH dehydrogenase subunit 4 [Ascaridia galli]ANE06336.1 NADH dehydrogenase subunit 4 [Ascaridia galli]
MALLALLLLSLYFFDWSSYFLLLMLVVSFLMLSSFCWGGVFFVGDSYTYIMLIIMSLFILGVVMISEKNKVLRFLSSILVVICFFFFVPGSMLMLYMFFELSIFPIIVMILGYGSQIEKVNSAYYLLFYAALCSFPFLFIYFKSLFFVNFVYFDFVFSWEMLFILSLSFMMKFPVFFLHLWLPKAHVEAPTTASMLLAGLLLKLGTAGFLRIMKCFYFVHINFWWFLGVIGMLMASFSCIFQSDAKSLAAYSSITHMSFLLLSLVFLWSSSKVSGFMMMLSHGYVSTLMFYMVGEFFHVSGSRLIYYMNGFFSSSIFLGILFSVVFMANSGVPPSLSFLTEFITISVFMHFVKGGFWLIFLYFFLSFYYSIYFLTNAVMGKSYVDVVYMNVGFSIPLVVMMYNIVWCSILL